MYQQTTWPVSPVVPPSWKAEQPPGGTVLPSWLTSGLLLLASGVLFALAGASAWLSYHAQVSYVQAHNGDQAAEARVWALLLDTGTAGVSLLRLYETLRRGSGAATRISLLGCIAASLTMNMLHAPSRSPGGLLVAAVPPVMYAVFLEHLLANLRTMLTAGEERRGVWRTIVLWINFPALMWRARRESLRRDAVGALAAPEPVSRADRAVPRCSSDASAEVAQDEDDADGSGIGRSARRVRRSRGPGTKRVAFEKALAHQVRSGDLRLFSKDERERNAAAYQAAASLPAPLSRGTARRYVVQALPRLEVAGAEEKQPTSDDA